MGFRDYPQAVLQGSTAHFNVYYDPLLGVAGQRIGNVVLGVCERDYRRTSQIFGGIAPRYQLSYPWRDIVGAGRANPFKDLCAAHG